MQKLGALLGCIGLFLLPVALRAAPRPPTEEAEPDSHLTVAVADFPGEDKALGHFLSDTLLTDLGHSDRLQILERNELHQAQADLDIRDSGPMTPSQVRHLGDLIHASRIVVGSYLVRDDQVVLNARLLDTQSGLSVPGSAFNVTGSRKSLLTVMHRLAKQLHRRLTGEDLLLEEIDANSLPPERETKPQEPAPFLPEETDTLEPFKRIGLIPAAARANSPLVERDLAGFVGRLAKRVTPQTDNVFHLAQTAAPVTRLQALAALVKLLVSAADIATFHNVPAASLTPDGGQVPLWGQPYLAAALDQGWWDAGSAFRSRGAATWGFVQILLEKLPLEQETPRAPARRSEPPAISASYTGLILDVRDFDLQRDHSPTIVDEDGNTVYPDPKHVPNADYVDANGVAGYVQDESDAHRSGSHPLIIRAIGVSGPGPFDVVVSNEDARRIVEANRRSKFLWKWNVTLLVR